MTRLRSSAARAVWWKPRLRLRPRDARGLHTLGREITVPAGQYSDVSGRYGLGTPWVVGTGARESLVAASLDVHVGRAQSFVRERCGALGIDRYTIIPLVPPGRGLCPEACTGSPEGAALRGVVGKPLHGNG